jgi:hypothetical protein
MSRRRIRIAYVLMATTAFCLALVAGSQFAIATSGFVLCASLAGAFIASRVERREAPSRGD